MLVGHLRRWITVILKEDTSGSNQKCLLLSQKITLRLCLLSHVTINDLTKHIHDRFIFLLVFKQWFVCLLWFHVTVLCCITEIFWKYIFAKYLRVTGLRHVPKLLIVHKPWLQCWEHYPVTITEDTFVFFINLFDFSGIRRFFPEEDAETPLFCQKRMIL